MSIDNYEKLKKAMLAELIESQYQEEVARLLELHPIEDKQAQQDLVELITQRAVSDDAIGYAEYTNARLDLASRALHLNGFNPQGENFGAVISKEDFNKLLNVTLGGEQGIVDDDVVKLLLRYQNDKNSYNIDSRVKGYVDDYLSNELPRVVEIANEKGIDVPQSAIDEIDLSQSLSENNQPANPPANVNIPADELLTENEFDQSVATVERGDLDFAPDYVRDGDRENEARKIMSKIMENALAGDPQNGIPGVVYVERRVVDKLKSFVKNKAADALDSTPLDYPSESLFSNSLSEMDDNGRVTKIHLHYRRNKVVMPSAQSPKEVYDIMAAKVMEKGIKNPYIKANFSNPKDAEKFIRGTIDSLTRVGYDIEDINCHPRHAVLFESIKERYLNSINTIEEAPEKPELTVDDNELPTLEEVNQSVSLITNARMGSKEGEQDVPPVPVEQFTADQLNTLLEHHKLLEPMGVDRHGDDVVLTPRNAATVKIGVEYLEKLLNKVGTERGLGSREAEKMSAVSPELLKEVFSDKPEVLIKISEFEAQGRDNTQRFAPSGTSASGEQPNNSEHPQDNYQNESADQHDIPVQEGGDMQNAGGFPPDDAEPATEAAPSPPNYDDDDRYVPQDYDDNEVPPDVEFAGSSQDYQNSQPVNVDVESSNMAPSLAPEEMNQQNGAKPHSQDRAELSKADSFLMSIATTAKKHDGSLAFMSDKQIKTVAAISYKANLPEGDPNRTPVNEATKAMIEKVKKSVVDDIAAMKNGERLSKERYKALVSQSERVISTFGGESAVADLNAIKEKSAARKAPETKHQEVPQKESPEQTHQQSAPASEKLNVEGEKGKALDLFSLPKASHEIEQELDIPRKPESVDLFSLSHDELAKLQSENPELVSQSLNEMLANSANLPSEESRFDDLPESVKQANADLLGLDKPVQEKAAENEIEQPVNGMDEPKRTHPSPSRKR